MEFIWAPPHAEAPLVNEEQFPPAFGVRSAFCDDTFASSLVCIYHHRRRDQSFKDLGYSRTLIKHDMIQIVVRKCFLTLVGMLIGMIESMPSAHHNKGSIGGEILFF